MRSSSLVGMTQILTWLLGELMTPSLPEACALEAASISMPKIPSRSQLAAANRRRVLANAAGEDQAIHLSQYTAIRRDVLANAIGEDIDGQLGSCVARLGLLLQLAHVTRDSGNSIETAVLVEQRGGFMHLTGLPLPSRVR
jgi:hypothetical protein